MNWNLSYSAYSTFKSSPLQFYFQYLIKSRPSNECNTAYGIAGNIVHSAMEDWINKKQDNFNKIWDEKDGDNLIGFKGRKLSKESYYQMFQTGIEYCKDINLLDKSFVTELRIDKEFYGINFKGFLDVYTQLDTSLFIIDWKTNSTNTYEMHKLQRLFYSWLIWKIKGIIPSCNWVYLKSNKIHPDLFTPLELAKFGLEIEMFLENIKKWGTDISKYEAGNYNNPFNQYYKFCEEEVNNRNNSKEIKIILNIKGNFVFIENEIPQKLIEGIDFATKFDLPDKYHMQQAVKKRGGMFNLKEIGTIHLFNKNHNCFPIGLMDKIKNIIKEFEEYYQKKIDIEIIDSRDKKIMYQNINTPNELITNNKIRPYQQQAINAFMIKESGIIQIPTGGGKTFVATEIIRLASSKTLWIIDRQELLLQTKKVLEELLEMDIGVIYGGKIDIKDITIATVQSLNSKLNELQDYLSTISFVVVDEFHKSAAESYQKVFAKLCNTRFRLGLTATPKRDDGKDPILFSILGDIVYSISIKKLILLGYLIKPKIYFHQLSGYDLFSKTYPEDYQNNIVNNQDRNLVICDLCHDNFGKKILILTKSIEHGKELLKGIHKSEHIHGKSKKREEVMQQFRDGNIEVLIGTLSIFSEGIDIPDLDIIINAGANKGDVKSIQIIGRVLRIIDGKESAEYHDFLDIGKHTKKHSQLRIKALESEGHEVQEI